MFFVSDPGVQLSCRNVLELDLEVQGLDPLARADPLGLLQSCGAQPFSPRGAGDEQLVDESIPSSELQAETECHSQKADDRILELDHDQATQRGGLHQVPHSPLFGDGIERIAFGRIKLVLQIEQKWEVGW